MKYRKVPRLQPLGQATAPTQVRQEAEALARLQRIWPRTVSPALAACTHPMRVRRGTLLIGCWPAALVTSVRSGAEGAWPQLRERLSRMAGLPLQRLEITAAEPPQEPTEPPKPADPLQALLEWARLRNSHWNRKRG